MRRLRLTVPLMTLFVLSLPTSSDAVPPIAESEPNNDSATADALAGGECFVVGSGATNPAGDDDFWSFPAAAGASAWAYVDTGGTQNPGGTSRDSLMTLFGPDGTEIEDDNDDGIGNGGDSSVESGAASAIGGASLSSGTHSLRVEENGDDAVIDPYRLFVAVPTAAPTPEAEPNDVFGEANPISGCPEVRSGTISSGTDQDWFAVTAAAGETLFIVAADTPNLRVSLRSPPEGGAILVSGPITAFPAPPATGFSYDISAAGTYFVRVAAGMGAETGPYRLMVGKCDLTAASCAATDQPPSGRPGQDRCAGRAATHVGTNGNDEILGTNGKDVVLALGGNDVVKSRDGNDVVCGGPGNDRLRMGNSEKGGADMAFGQGGRDKLFGQGGRDVLRGGAKKDLIKAGSGKDRLFGQGGNDNLRGQGGSDQLNGGPGIDRCVQGAGTGPEVSCER
jgi:Ca2+-binding RTX toxin-like protein